MDDGLGLDDDLDIDDGLSDDLDMDDGLGLDDDLDIDDGLDDDDFDCVDAALCVWDWGRDICCGFGQDSGDISVSQGPVD